MQERFQRAAGAKASRGCLRTCLAGRGTLCRAWFEFGFLGFAQNAHDEACFSHEGPRALLLACP